MMLIGFVFFQLFAKNIVSLFTSDKSMIDMAIPAFRSLCFCFLLTAPNIIMTGLLQGLGKGGLSFSITYTRFFIFLVPFSYLLDRFWGLNGLYFCYFSADVPTIFLLIGIYAYVNRKVLCNKTQQIVA